MKIQLIDYLQRRINVDHLSNLPVNKVIVVLKQVQKRPKTAKKKQLVVNLTSDKKSDSIITTENDLFKSAIVVQNYESNTTNIPPSSNIERLPISTTTILRRTPSVLRRSSTKSNEGQLEVKQNFDHIDTQMTAPTTNQIEVEKNKEQVLTPITNTITETKLASNDQLIQQQQNRLELVDNRKRIKKGAFDAGESMGDLVAFELGMMGSNRGAMRKNRFGLGKEKYPESQ